MTEDAFYDALAAEAAHDDDEVILAEARERLAAGEKIRGLRRPDDAPAESWWSVQRRERGGTYLYLRWRDNNFLRARSLGRLD